MVNHPRSPRRVHFTFDDGPHPHHTSAILDVLNTHSISATFFVTGKNVEKYGKALVQRAMNEGHGIGNHGFSHKRLTELDEEDVGREIMMAEDLIADFLGSQKLFRPPYGSSNAVVERVVTRLGYRQLLWDVDTLDWNPQYQSDRWVQHSVDQICLRQDSIVLAHDKHPWTASWLEEFIDRLRRASVTFPRWQD
jgi:peptidoglycan/xylan/chitin deacetylase (PgdA/CDA1 family)